MLSRLIAAIKSRRKTIAPPPAGNYVGLMGGLGNQLFQYAYARYLVANGVAVSALATNLFDHDPYARKPIVQRISRLPAIVLQRKQIAELKIMADEDGVTMGNTLRESGETGVFCRGYWQDPRYASAVSVELAADLQAFGVDGGESAIGNEGLAAHLHPGGWVLQLQAQRHTLNRAHVGGDVLAAFAIAAGGGPHQQALLVAEGQGIAVDLEFAHHRQCGLGLTGGGLAIEHLEQAAVPGLQIVGAEGVIEAQQADAVGHAREPLCRGSPDPLRGTVRADQLGVGRLGVQQLAVEPVVHRILHLRSIQHVIGVGSPLQQAPQLLGPGAVISDDRTHAGSGSGELLDAIDPPVVFHLHEGEVEG